ncbi:YutD-like domain-containing protein [Cohnella candidum]|uniref:DUF1027 domain-containing protein n=1 Tax=Cohnella candidum TaxID=2674991 RepID=A0A3G3JSY7_9BACL|nr:YutD-like domain-containing protein [Cohnella candidum]AYQ71340.1 DUF1027 domain-containing protein [Cohnella candidum]
MIFLAGGNAYTMAREHKNGWNAEAFKERYSEVLERYDFIVGDWGYNQLRLRGFYQDGHPRATKETSIASLVDYLNEYCNFGCAYFVLAKTDAAAVPPGTPDLIKQADAPTPAAGDNPDAQTAETAAALATHNGILMRWPLKERPGGPVRIPGAAAVARAAAEAERRQQALAGGKPGDGRASTSSNRQGGDGGYGNRQANRPSSGGGSDRRSSGGPNAGQADNRSSGKPGNRGQRPPQGERQGQGAPSKPGGQWRQPSEGGRQQEQARTAEHAAPKPDAAQKNGSRWPGKNRRRNRFGGKPNRPDGGAPGHPGAD